MLQKKILKLSRNTLCILLCGSILLNSCGQTSATSSEPTTNVVDTEAELTASPLSITDAPLTTPSTTEIPTGVTNFKTYKAQKINSPYYSDPGKEPLTTEYDGYRKVKNSYFKDAAFIGDSLMEGFYNYLDLKDIADFYCEKGYSFYNWSLDTNIVHMNTGEKESLTDIMNTNSYGKIYILLGMNDLGYGNTELYDKRVTMILEKLKKQQPNAIIYLMGALHFSKERNKDKVDNNININDKNTVLANHADGKTIFYLDSNPLFTNKKGYQKDELSSDGCHVFGYNYVPWLKFLKKHAV